MMIILLCILACIFIVGMVFISKTENNTAQEDRLNDELLYDHLTGKKITLEEAEQGIVLENHPAPRIKPDREIEENYSDDQKEIEYILRDFIASGIDEIDRDSDEEAVFDRILAQAEYARGLDTKVIHYLWEFNPGLFVGLVYVSYAYLGKGQGPFHEYQTFAIIDDQSDASAFATIQDAHVELIDNAVLVWLPKRTSYAGFKDFVEDVNNRTLGKS